MGVTHALVQSWGTWPESSDFWKSTERNRAISFLRFFKTMCLMESGPDALLGFRLQSSFMMPGTDIVISGIGWYLLCSVGGNEWLPILSLSMPFCKTWVASWFNDRGAFLWKPFEIADSQYQLCPYFELPNFQNLASVGVSWMFFSGRTVSKLRTVTDPSLSQWVLWLYSDLCDQSC